MTMETYLDALTTPAVMAVRDLKGVAGVRVAHDVPATLQPTEIEHITARDSCYIATVGESGWPYVQHRGGDVGFVKVLGPTRIGWIERTGNRQYLGTGNITADDRVSMIFVDYPNRTRLKLRGHATYHPDPSPELIAALGGAATRADGAISVEIAATDWNCPKHITPRFTADQVAGLTGELQARIEELERQLADRGRDASSP